MARTMSPRQFAVFQAKRQDLLERIYQAARPGALDCEGFEKGRYKPELARLVELTRDLDRLEITFEDDLIALAEQE